MSGQSYPKGRQRDLVCRAQRGKIRILSLCHGPMVACPRPTQPELLGNDSNANVEQGAIVRFYNQRMELVQHITVALVASVALGGCGIGHHNSAPGAPAEVVGTYDAQCAGVSGSESASLLGTHRALHVDGGGTATFKDDGGVTRSYGLHLVGTSIYQGQRDTGSGVDELVIDLPNNQVREALHSGSTSTPVVSGTTWAIVKTSSG